MGSAQQTSSSPSLLMSFVAITASELRAKIPKRELSRLRTFLPGLSSLLLGTPSASERNRKKYKGIWTNPSADVVVLELEEGHLMPVLVMSRQSMEHVDCYLLLDVQTTGALDRLVMEASMAAPTEKKGSFVEVTIHGMAKRPSYVVSPEQLLPVVRDEKGRCTGFAGPMSLESGTAAFWEECEEGTPFVFMDYLGSTAPTVEKLVVDIARAKGCERKKLKDFECVLHKEAPSKKR